MKKMFIIAVLLIGVIGFSSPAIADSIHLTEADGAPAFYIYNYGFTGVVSVVITTNGAGDNMSVTCDGLVNTVDGSGDTDTIAELCAAINACTNKSGAVGIQCITDPSLDADSTDGDLIDGTYNAEYGSQTNYVKWDTSVVKHYDLFIDNDYQPVVIDQIFGSVTGTGDATFDVYVDRVKKWTTVVPVPVGVSHTNDANLVTLSSILALPLDCGVPVPANSTAFIRATRTTATTGNLGAILKPQR